MACTGSSIEVLDSESEPVPPPPKRKRTATVPLGPFQIDPIGLGTMPLGIEYPDPALRPSRAAALELLREALRSGVQLLDTADSYCAGPGGSSEAAAPHYVERLIAEATRGAEVRVCAKGGMVRLDSTSRGWRPAPCSGPAVRRMIAASREALGRPVDLFMLHHTDGLGQSQLEEALHAMRSAVADGEALSLGLANANLASLEVAERLGIKLAAVQNQYSLWLREAEQPPRAARSSKKGVLDWCSARGVAFMPYGVLGGVQARDGRRSLRRDFPSLLGLANEKNVSPEALVLAWMRQRFPCIIHIVGARSLQHVLDCAEARDVRLTAAEVERISALKPASAQARDPSKVLGEVPHIVQLAPRSLQSAASELLRDLAEDVRKLSADTGAQVALEAEKDRVLLKGGLRERAAADTKLREVLRFYFGDAVPK